MYEEDDRAGKRGPYKSQAVLQEESRRQAEMLTDPDVVAFAEALAKITDPKKRAHIAWLVEEFSRRRPLRG